MSGLQPGHITVRLRGTAGQSLGAFAVQGLKLEVIGDANDYVGKGLSGATIVVRLAPSSALVSQDNTIIGNTCLYGATAGELFAAGQAGERFAVRNSGATAVVEGCGSNGCEYMTGGTVVSLGAVGDNFGAGFTGGQAFIFDADGTFEHRINPDNVAVAADRAPALGRDAARPGGATRRRDEQPLCRQHAGGLGPYAAAVLASGAEGVRQVPTGADAGGSCVASVSTANSA